MTDEGPRDYDLEYTAPEGGPVRRRLGIDTERGIVTRFVVQLEYLLDPAAGEWATVVRYDHDAEGSDEAAHDVTEEGLHIDVYRDGEKHRTHELIRSFVIIFVIGSHISTLQALKTVF